MIKVVLLENHYIPRVVCLHNLAFKDFFLTQLGDDFLKLYYTSILQHEDGMLIGYFESNELHGFCAVTTYSKGFNSRMIQKKIIPFGLIGIKLLFTKPGSLVRLFNNFTKSDPSIKDEGEYGELLSIGVDPDKQGKGVGKQLLLELEKRLKSKGINKLSLTTDYFNNDKAIGFYKSMGYGIMYEFTAYPNRKMYRLIKQL